MPVSVALRSRTRERSSFGRAQPHHEGGIKNDPRVWAATLGERAAASIVKRFSSASEPAAGPIDVVDLFCGCGGLSSGFEFVGRLLPSYRLAGAVDIDAHSISTYSETLPIPPVQADLAEATVSPLAIKRLVSRLSLRSNSPLVLIGGPPCQGFSAHRKKDRRRRDRRNNLVLAFARIVAHL